MSKTVSKELLAILEKATSSKIYGSVEIYFEDGKITQITQRIISKVSHTPKKAAVTAHS